MPAVYRHGGSGTDCTAGDLRTNQKITHMDDILKTCRFLIGVDRAAGVVKCDAMLPSGERAGVVIEVRPGDRLPKYLDEYERFTVERYLKELNVRP